MKSAALKLCALAALILLSPARAQTPLGTASTHQRQLTNADGPSNLPMVPPADRAAPTNTVGAADGERLEGGVRASPVDTVFTYQGQLKVSGSPANGPYDMQFTLYDDLGVVVAGPICRDNVQCTGGLFTVELDFAAQFSGDKRELQIDMRLPGGIGDCAVGGAYTALSPRQKLTAAPYALFSAAPWATNGINIFKTNAGNVGIGTPSPTQALEVVGRVKFRDAFGQAGTGALHYVNDSGYMFIGPESGSSNNGAGMSLAGPSDTITGVPGGVRFDTGSGIMVITSGGNVGIGTIAPANKLDVEGGAAIGATYSGTNAAPANGLIVEGKVGIGTTTPASALHIGNGYVRVDRYGAGPAIFGRRAQGTPTAPTAIGSGDILLFLACEGYDGTAFSSTPPSISLSASEAWTSTAHGAKITFTTSPNGTVGANERVRIQDDGNVGIGTTTPVNKLDVAGAAAIGATYSGTNTAPANGLIVEGNVGIGTTSPGTALEVRKSSGNPIRFGGTGAGATGNLIAGTSRVSIATDDLTERLSILQSNGNVGIGTTVPSEKLHVVGNICATGTIGVCSDERFKNRIEPLCGALEKVEQLRGVQFDWKREEFPEHQFSECRQVGLIAQEVEQVMPEVVSRGSDGYLSVDYGRLTPLLVEAMKELKTENADLKARLEKLEALVNKASK